MDSYHRRALDIRGHWQVRFGLVWLAVCQPDSECPSHWPPLGLPGRGFKLKAAPARQMHRSQVPSTAMARAGRRGCMCPRDTEAPHAGTHGPAGQLTGTCCQRLGLDGSLDPPWPVFLFGSAWDMQMHRRQVPSIVMPHAGRNGCTGRCPLPAMLQ